MTCEPEYNYDGTILKHLPEEYDGMFEVPEGVTEIADEAFMYCQSLSAISLPSTLTKIGESAFKLCESLQAITIPDSVTEIGQAAFSMCHSLTDVVLSRSLCEIADEAFRETAIKHIVIPESVRSIGESAFEDCYNLYDVVLPENIRIADSAFNGCGGLHSADALYLNLHNNPHYKLIQVFPHAKGYKIPDDVVEIGSGAFKNSSIVHLEVPGSIKVIHNSAFSGITSLKSIKICNGVTSLPDRCFQNCESLEEVSFPESIDTIGIHCFAGCTKLEEIVLPDKLTEISESLFEGCGSLKSVTIGRNIIKVGSKAFMNCTALKEILIPDSVRSLGDECFEGCSSLKRINFSDSLKIIPYRAFASCTELETITLPKNLNKIEDKAFLGCSSLKEVIGSESASVEQDSFRGTLVKDARLLPEFKYYGRLLPSEWESETVSGDTLLTVYRGFSVEDVETANAIIDDIKKNGLYLEQITEKFPSECSYKSSVGHKKFSKTELDELYANKIPVDYALQGVDKNQVYFGDYHCAMYYATRYARSPVAILIEAKMSLNELNVDGTDSLAIVFDSENNNTILREVFGNKIDLYLEKLQAETTSTDEESTRRIRKAVLNMAQSDNDIVYAFYNNDLLIRGKWNTKFKYALQAKLPIAPERIVSVKIVQNDSSSFTESSRTITLGDLRKVKQNE